MKKIKYILFISIIMVYFCECMEIIIPLLAALFKLIKHGVAVASFFVCGLSMSWNFLRARREKILFLSEIKKFGIVFAYFALVSVYQIYHQGRYTFKTLEELLQLAIPFLFAFFVINELKFEEIMRIMKICLAVSFGAYLYTQIPNLWELFENIALISYSGSYSPFESSDFAEMSAGLVVFFVYYRKKCPGWAVLSILFVFMTFKRVFLLQCLLILVVAVTGLSRVRLSIWVTRVSVLIAVAATAIFNFLLQEKNAALFMRLFGMSSGDFTMGRSYRLWYKLNHFKSFGFGSTSALLGQNLELDLIKILIEIGIVGLFLFVWCYFSLGRRNLYTYTVVGTMLLNLLFASGLTATVGWIARVIALGVILYEDGAREERRQVRRFRFRLVLKR